LFNTNTLAELHVFDKRRRGGGLLGVINVWGSGGGQKKSRTILEKNSTGNRIIMEILVECGVVCSSWIFMGAS
jgi:hypothetical protein